MFRVHKAEPPGTCEQNSICLIFEGKNLCEEESLAAIFLTPKVKGETKHQKSPNTLKISKIQVQ